MTTIHEIQAVVSEHFGTPLIEMTSDRKGSLGARPRQVAMYLARVLTPHSLPSIGWHFRRDHSTVHHAIARIEELAKADPDFGQRVASLRAQLDTS